MSPSEENAGTDFTLNITALSRGGDIDAKRSRLKAMVTYLLWAHRIEVGGSCGPTGRRRIHLEVSAQHRPLTNYNHG